MWRKRQDNLRKINIDIHKKEVDKALREIEEDENRRLGLSGEGNRRAVVFYVANEQQMR